MSDTGNIRNELKAMFKGYRVMTKSMRHRLKNLGFYISEDGKHYKIFYGNDMRHPYVLSKTASDYRTGRNFVSCLLRGLNN